MQFALFSLWLGLIGTGATIAWLRDRSPGLAALMCALFGPIGVTLVALFLRRRQPILGAESSPPRHFSSVATELGTLALEEAVPAP